MPYEAEIPPVPTRDQELKMIEKISADFLAQGTFEPNIAEADRVAKLDLNLTLWEYRWNYRINWILGFGGALLITMPAAHYVTNTRSTGVPITYRPKVYVSGAKRPFMNQYRNMRKISVAFIPAFFLAHYYAMTNTDRIFQDELLEKHKVKYNFND